MTYKCQNILGYKLNTSWALVFGLDTHVCTVSNIIDNTENKISLPNKEYLNGHWCDKE